MVLYSLLAVPTFCLFIVASKLSESTDSKRLWGQYSRGVLVFIPAFLILLAIRRLVPLHYTYAGVFAYYLFYQALYYSVLASAGYLLIRQFSPQPDRGSVSEALVFLAGFFTFASVLDIVRHFPYFDAYQLFLYPTMKLSVIAALGFLLARYFASASWSRWAYLVIGVLFVAATALVPFFFVIHLGYVAVIVAAALFVVSLFPYVLMQM